jgi:D-lactate dehydrogenase (cytochrome)
MGLQEELIAALDAQRVVTGADELRRHGTDEGWHRRARPTSSSTRATPRRRRGRPRLPRRTARRSSRSAPGRRLEGHVAALRGGVSVDTAQMDQILRLSVEDMDVTVQAGVTRRQLDAKLRPEGVFFSVDPARTRRSAGWSPPEPPGRPRPLRDDARERPQPHRRHGRRRGRAYSAHGRGSRPPAMTSRGCSSARRARSA